MNARMMRFALARLILKLADRLDGSATRERYYRGYLAAAREEAAARQQAQVDMMLACEQQFQAGYALGARMIARQGKPDA